MSLRRLLSIASLLVAFSLVPAFAHAQTLDQYGGFKDLQVPGGATGHFRVAKLNSRWVFATPDGNAFWMTGVYNVNIDDHVTDLGTTYTRVCDAKYGDHSLTWGPQQNRRLKSWGFNTLGEYASRYTLPWATSDDPKWPGKVQPVKMAAIPFPLQGAWYSQTGRDNYAPGPVKEIYWAMDSHFKGYRGQFPDVFDPNFDLWVNGRLTSKEYAILATSPWLIGFSGDDTDYLTGFGPGPDFDSGGHAHSHLGFVTLLTPPTQAQNLKRGVTYTDTKVYTKYALRDFLRAKYGSIAALNSAWGSTYTTFDSNGGWPIGSGLLDENGKGTWVGTDSVGLTNAIPAVKADLDEFLYNIAKQYFSIYRTRIKQHYPNVLYLGPTTIGGWGAPARRQVLRAAGQYVDVLRTSWNGDQDRLDFTAQHAGDLPVAVWLGGVANPDSAIFRYPNGNQGYKFTSQSERAAFYQSRVSKLLSVTAPGTGVKPFVGLQWWEFHDNWAEKANWGLVTLSDNAYDGKEAIAAAGKDPWGYATGGEQLDHGNFLGTVIQTNKSVYAQLSGAPPVSPPSYPGTSSGAVSIISPTSRSTVQGLVSVAAAGAGNISRIDFALDEKVVRSFYTANATFPWDTRTVPNGSHRWTAKAYNASGSTGASSSVDLVVKNTVTAVDANPPSVSITVPAFSPKSKVTIRADATDNLGVKKVEFYVEGRLTCTVTTGPYACEWTVPAATKRMYSFQVKAYDAQGNVGASPTVGLLAR